MINKIDRNEARQKRKKRVRGKISGTATCPRLNVNRSLNHVRAQIIDDVKGVTLVSASTLEKNVAKLVEGKTKTQAAQIVGEQIAKAALKAGITKVVFDRAGYVYKGRVKAVADGARSAGLEF